MPEAGDGQVTGVMPKVLTKGRGQKGGLTLRTKGLGDSFDSVRQSGFPAKPSLLSGNAFRHAASLIRAPSGAASCTLTFATGRLGADELLKAGFVADQEGRAAQLCNLLVAEFTQHARHRL